MKVCSKCKLEKPLSDFNKNKNKPDGLHNYCKICSAINSAKHYKNNKQSYRDSKNKSCQILRQFVLKYLLEHPCIDCKESDPVVLEFDHVNGTKTRNISEMIHAGVSLSNLKLEIEKCEIRCANCHKRKTAKDFEWYKYIP